MHSNLTGLEESWRPVPLIWRVPKKKHSKIGVSPKKKKNTLNIFCSNFAKRNAFFTKIGSKHQKFFSSYRPTQKWPMSAVFRRLSANFLRKLAVSKIAKSRFFKVLPNVTKSRQISKKCSKRLFSHFGWHSNPFAYLWRNFRAKTDFSFLAPKTKGKFWSKSEVKLLPNTPNNPQWPRKLFICLAVHVGCVSTPHMLCTLAYWARKRQKGVTSGHLFLVPTKKPEKSRKSPKNSRRRLFLSWTASRKKFLIFWAYFCGKRIPLREVRALSVFFFGKPKI